MPVWRGTIADDRMVLTEFGSPCNREVVLLRELTRPPRRHATRSHRACAAASTRCSRTRSGRTRRAAGSTGSWSALILLSVAAAVLATGARRSAASWDHAWLVIEARLRRPCSPLEYGLRVWASVEDRAGRYEHPLWGRLRYMATPDGADRSGRDPADLAGASCCPATSLLLRTLRMLRVLKITRYSPALATFEIVLVNERRSLARRRHHPGRGAAARRGR